MLVELLVPFPFGNSTIDSSLMKGKFPLNSLSIIYLIRMNSFDPDYEFKISS